MKRSLWKELCNKLNFASKTNCKSFEVTPIIRTVYITHPSPVHLCLSPFCVWLPLGYGNWRNSHVSISTAARLNERILCPFFNMEGLFKSGTQNKKLNMKEAAATTPKQHLKNMSTLWCCSWLQIDQNFMRIFPNLQSIWKSLMVCGKKTVRRPRVYLTKVS